VQKKLGALLEIYCGSLARDWCHARESLKRNADVPEKASCTSEQAKSETAI
jgi:hypothetical protein